MIEVAVTTNLECAHRDMDGGLHGHSYVVELWFAAGPDLAQFAALARRIAEPLDHTLLDDSLGSSRMEDIATYFLQETSAHRVVVRRPTLGYAVTATR